MSTRAEIVDAYFRRKDYFPWVPYEPIGKTMVEEVERQGENGLYLSTAAALVEQESGGKSLFGCDHGTSWAGKSPFCQDAVTRARVQALIRDINEGYGSNGVGLTQLTSPEYIFEAEKLGGAHLPRYQMRVGFRVLLDHILNLGWPAGAAAYNAGAGNWRSVINTYGASMARLQAEWAERLAGADDEEPEPYVVIYTKTPEQAERIAKRWERRGYETETGEEGGINLNKYTPTDRHGLTPHSDRVRQHLEEALGDIITWVEGYRPSGDGTEHATRRAIDLGFEQDNKAHADRMTDYLIKHWDELGIHGLILWAGQTGYDLPPGQWIPQRWNPPPEYWQKYPNGDAYHYRHAHILVEE